MWAVSSAVAFAGQGTIELDDSRRVEERLIYLDSVVVEAMRQSLQGTLYEVFAL